MSAVTTPIEHEAAMVLAFFTEAPDGEAVMDGVGKIWRHFAGYWYSGRGVRARRAASADLARALCPDLAEHMAVTT